ncbi:MAG: electron transfer flavoprotein subunit alpha/FixB family protein [Chloroflexi bacterium]|nr:electron transfer flavoprotein subunit alpha/FixB family protein [Chloroflexota bacterium]
MSEKGGVLIVAETAEGGLAPISAELLAAAQQLAGSLGVSTTALLVGSGLGAAADELAALGPGSVLVADDDRLADLQPDVVVSTLAAAVAACEPKVVLFGHTSAFRESAVRLAYRLGAAITTDATAVRVEDGTVVLTKPVYGGAAIAEYASDGPLTIATVRPRVYEAVTGGGSEAAIEALTLPADLASRTRVLENVREAASSGPRLKDAKIVVSGGRGVGGPENWPSVEEAAAALGAAVGATRAVTDAGWVPPTHQVGLTGTTISPDLYVTVAISGAVQHIAGCSGSRNIVAINKDPDANIFRHARFGVVGDYAKVLPAFTRRVKELRG